MAQRTFRDVGGVSTTQQPYDLRHPARHPKTALSSPRI